MFDPLQRFDVAVAILAFAGSVLTRRQFPELGLPIPQDMLVDVQHPADFANGIIEPLYILVRHKPFPCSCYSVPALKSLFFIIPVYFIVIPVYFIVIPVYFIVILAQAGIQTSYCYFLDSGFRRNDDMRLSPLNPVPFNRHHSLRNIVDLFTGCKLFRTIPG